MDEKAQRSLWAALIVMGSAFIAYVAWSALRDGGVSRSRHWGGAGGTFVAFVGLGLSVRHYLEGPEEKFGPHPEGRGPER